MDNFLDASREDLAVLSLQVDHSNSNATLISAALGEICTIEHNIKVEDPRPIAEYHVVLCRSPHLAESSSCEIKLSPDGNRLGHFFPLSALRSGYGIDDGWPSKFAEVGFRKLTSLAALDKYSTIRTIEGLRDRVVFLDEVFADNSALCTFSKAALANHNINAETLELMLLEHGIQIASGPEVRLAELNEKFEFSNKLRMPCSEAIPDAKIFSELIKRGDSNISEPGSFLQYYQVVEYCIDRIFDIELAKVPGLNLDSWTLREKLANVSSEKHRIAILNSEYLTKQVRRDRFAELKTACSDLLRDTDAAIDEGSDWHQWLYKVRNVLIHSQIRMQKQAGEMNIVDLNLALRRACFELLFYFDINDT